MIDDSPILFVSWRSPTTRAIHPVGRLTYDPAVPRYEFVYIRNVRKAVADGFIPFPEFPKLDGLYLSKELFPLFSIRVMPKSRPGYADFLAGLGLGIEDAKNPMRILARTGGTRQTDQIELFPKPMPSGEPGCYSTNCLMRAIRYMPSPNTEDRIAKLISGEELFPMLDLQNKSDPNALAVRTHDNFLIGYLPAYLARDFLELHSRCPKLNVFVERVNTPPAEIHNRVLLKITTCWPEGFIPFDTEEFKSVGDRQVRD